MTTRTRIVRVGNSRGIRLPRLLLDQAGVAEAETPEVELRAEPGRIIIEVARPPRAGWAEAAARQAAVGEDALLDAPTPTAFDRAEWSW